MPFEPNPAPIAPRRGSSRGVVVDTGRRSTTTRTWRERVEDPDEPLFTIAVAADLLGAEHQVLRRMGAALELAGTRPSGNQRRYSRRDLETLGAACELGREGFSPHVVARLLQVQRSAPSLAHARRMVRVAGDDSDGA